MRKDNVTEAIMTTDGAVLIALGDGTYRRAESQTDWARLQAMSENDIENLAGEDRKELGIDPDWMVRTTILHPRTKERVTVRLDRDILEWLKAQGRGYQTRINAILRAYVETDRHRRQ